MYCFKLFFLIIKVYSGIHYDATSDLTGKTRFSNSDSHVFSDICSLVNELHISKKYTDISNFQLRCSTCKIGLIGQVDASNHAKTTNHLSFEEF